MTEPPPHQITQILQAIRSREERASERLLSLVYDELRQLARKQMAGERPGHTLQPTALVHEAYLRLFGGQESPSWENRAHFFGAAAEAMRRILIERARSKARLKRGGDRERVTLEETAAPSAPSPEVLLDLDEALRRLEQQDPRMVQVVKLRYFAGLTVEETARSLDVTSRTVNRLWLAARAWIERELTRAG